MAMRRYRFLGLALALLLGLASPYAGPALAEDPAPATSPTDFAAEKAAAEAEAEKAKIVGPAKVSLLDQGVLDLPQGVSFVPQPQAGRFLKAYGNGASSALTGVIVPETEGAAWWATLEFIKSGYVKDEDAKTWKADELLKSLQDATTSQNDERAKRGFPPIEITGWIEPPRYDAATRRLVWSAGVREIGGDEMKSSINYNTYALGRDGYFSLDVIARRTAADQTKAAAADLLARISYLKGKTYEDFNASTDHIAEYGLAALVGGVALKKLGLIALAGAFVLKFAKIIGVAAIALIAGLRRLFRKPPPSPPTT